MMTHPKEMLRCTTLRGLILATLAVLPTALNSTAQASPLTQLGRAGLGRLMTCCGRRTPELGNTTMLRGLIAETLGRRLDAPAERLLAALAKRNSPLAGSIARSPQALHALEKHGAPFLRMMETPGCAPLYEHYGQAALEPLMQHPALTREILSNGGEALLPRLGSMSRAELQQTAIRLRAGHETATGAGVNLGAAAAGGVGCAVMAQQTAPEAPPPTENK